jgi:hypothetical protein
MELEQTVGPTNEQLTLPWLLSSID